MTPDLSSLIQKKLGYNVKESNYIKDIYRSYLLKESDSYYSLLPDLLRILDSSLSEEDKINDLAILLSLYYKNEPTYQDLDEVGVYEFIDNDINKNMVEIKDRLDNNQLEILIDKIISIYFKLN